MNSLSILSQRPGIAVFCLLVFCYSTVLQAASVDPGQVEKRFEKSPESLSEPSLIQVPETDGVEAPPGADTMMFNLQQFVIEGGTVYDIEVFKSYYQDLLNQTISLKQVYEIAARISRHYGDDGYLLSRAAVPPQTIDNGTVRLLIIEGYIDKVTIKDLDERPEIFQNYIDKIIASRPLKASVLERYLLLANDLHGVKFKSVLNPSADNVGAANLVLTPTLDLYEGSITLDNRGSESSGPWQMMMTATANNMFGRMEETTLRVATVPDQGSELFFLHLHHSYPLNGEGLKLGLDLRSTRTQPGLEALSLLNLETKGDSIGAELSYPVIRSRQENLSLKARLDGRSSKTLRLGTAISDDQLRAIRLGVSYDRADDFAGGGVNLVNATLVQGLDMLEAQVQSRLGAEEDFNKLELLLRRNQFLAKGWSLDLFLTGQLAGDVLPAAEQYGLGGENSVRGYEPAEWTGDRSLVGNLELRYEHETSFVDKLQYYAFYDHGKVWRENPNVLETDSSEANSTGVGVRMDISRVSLNLEADRTLETHADGDDPDWFVTGQLQVSF